MVLVGTFCGLLVSADGIPSTCFQLRFRNYFHLWKANCSITFVRWNCLLNTACSGLHLKCYLELVIILLCRCAPTTPVRSWSLPRGLQQSRFWARFCGHFLTSSAGTVFVHQWSIFLVTGMIWRMSSVALRVHRRPCHPQNVCIHRCIFCCAHVGAYVVLLRPNGLGRGRECEISCARSCYEGTCSGLSPSGRSELLFGAAPPCISLLDLFPMASIAFHVGLHGFDASAFSSLRTSYRLLGWVTFVHHSVKQHVRRLPALGYDSLEYFIFYIPFEYIGFGQIVWPILHTFTFEIFTEAREHPHTDPGQTVYVNLHWCLAEARPVC